MALTPEEQQELADLEELERLEAEEASTITRASVDQGLSAFLPKADGANLIDRFAAGLAQRSAEDAGIQNPEGLDIGDIVEFGAREALPAIGAGFGTAGGPAGIALGAATGRAAQKALSRGLGLLERGSGSGEIFQSDEGLRESAIDIGKTGAGTGLLSAGFGVAGEMAAVARPAVVGGLSRLIRALSGVKERVSKRVLENPSLFQTAPSVAEAGTAMGEIARKSGVQTGGEGLRAATGTRFSRQENTLNLLDDALNDLEAGTLIVQKAVAARQAASNELARPLFQNPLNSQDKRIIAESIGKLDEVIEPAVPGWREAVKNFADAMAVKEFGSILPSNANLSPNVIRTLLSGGVIGSGITSGNPLLAAAGTLSSPFVLSLPVRAAGRLSSLAHSGAGRALGLSTAARISEGSGVTRVVPSPAFTDPGIERSPRDRSTELAIHFARRRQAP